MFTCVKMSSNFISKSSQFFRSDVTPRAAWLWCTLGISRTGCRGPGVGARGAAPQPGSSRTRCPSCPAHKHPCRRGDARVGCPICPAARNLARTTAQTPSVNGKEGRKQDLVLRAELILLSFQSLPIKQSLFPKS